jgi:hypothetical protein
MKKIGGVCLTCHALTTFRDSADLEYRLRPGFGDDKLEFQFGFIDAALKSAQPNPR